MHCMPAFTASWQRCIQPRAAPLKTSQIISVSEGYRNGVHIYGDANQRPRELVDVATTVETSAASAGSIAMGVRLTT